MNAPRSLALFASVALACSAMAQGSYDPSAATASYAAQANSVSADPPARVARLAFVRGEVNFAPAGESDWVQAQLNRPVVTGDKLWTDNGGRAELQVGAATIRMEQRTSFDFLNLNDQSAQIELTQGSLDLDVRRVHGNETYEIDTPTLAFIADRVGDYRIDVDAQGNVTTVTVRRGGGAIYGEGGTKVQIGEGQVLTFDNPQLRDYRTARVEQRDDFDNFVADRDRRYQRPVAANYVSEDVVGYEDLDEYGSWSDAPEYGHVWYPNNVGSDWAPYHEGRWAWVEPWGWTWVDDAPWGFAPFHYGRWVNVESRWGWVPGPVDVRPVYAPALVAFVGGGGFGVDISVGGSVGWFALGPRDVYFPGYRCGRNYFTSINVSNARISNATVNNYYGGWSRGNVNYARIDYANRNRPGALAAMPTGAFASGHPVATSDLTMNSRAALANARVVPRAAVAPTRAGVLAANGRAPRTSAPAAAFNRQVVAAHAPPPAPASFAARQRLLQRTPGEPLSTPQLRSLAAQQPRHGANVRTLQANARGTSPVAPTGMNRTEAGSRNALAQERMQRGNERVQTASRNGVPMDARVDPRQPLRSSDFAHAQRGRDAQTATVQRGRSHTPDALSHGNAPAQTARTAAQPSQRPNGFATARPQATQRQDRATARQQRETAQQQRLASQNQRRAESQQRFERAAQNRVTTSVQRAPNKQRQVEQRAMLQERRNAAQPQHAQQYQRQADRGTAQRQEQRAAMQQRAPMQQPRAIERNAPQERRVVAQPRYQRPAERIQAPQQAQARPEAQRFNAPPRSQPQPAAARQQQLARQNAQPATPKKDKKDGGRD